MDGRLIFSGFRLPLGIPETGKKVHFPLLFRRRKKTGKEPEFALIFMRGCYACDRFARLLRGKFCLLDWNKQFAFAPFHFREMPMLPVFHRLSPEPDCGTALPTFCRRSSVSLNAPVFHHLLRRSRTGGATTFEAQSSEPRELKEKTHE